MFLALVLALQQVSEKDFPKDASPFTRVAEAGTQPALAFDPDGSTLYVAFIRDSKVRLSSSSDGGKSFSPSVPLEVPGRVPALRAPRLAVDKQKRVYLSVPAGEPPDLYLLVSKDRGATFSKPHVINETLKAAREGLHATAAGPAELHVAWLEEKNGKPALLYARYSDAGKRLAKPVVLSPAACERCPPALACDAQGNPLVAWRDLAKTPKAGRPLLLAHSSSKGGSFPPALPASPADSGLPDCPFEGPAAALHPNGSLFAAAWMDRRPLEDPNVFWTQGPPGKPGPDDFVPKDRRYPQTRPSLCIDADGAVWCAWEDSVLSNQRIFITNSSRTLYLPVGDPKTESRFGLPALAACGTLVALAYESGDGIGLRILARP